jgi:hypothetical protein
MHYFQVHSHESLTRLHVYTSLVTHSQAHVKRLEKQIANEMKQGIEVNLSLQLHCKPNRT